MGTAKKSSKTKSQLRKRRKTSFQAGPIDTGVIDVFGKVVSPSSISGLAAGQPEPTVDDVLHQWLSQSVPGQPIPDVDQLQVAWATFGSGGAFTVQVQRNLANLLNNAFFGSNVVVPSNLPSTLTVGQLKLNLHRSA